MEAGARRPGGRLPVSGRWATLASAAAHMVWDEQGWHTIGARVLQSCPEAGLLAQQVVPVNSIAIPTVWRGDFAEAASLIAAGKAIAAATGTRFPPVVAMLLAGFRGAEAEAAPLIEAVITTARATGQGTGVRCAHSVSAVLYNGLSRYEAALAQAQQAAEQAPELQVSMWALPELIEAASRTGQTDLAADALARLAQATASARPTGHRGSTRAAGRCSVTARTPSAGTVKRLTG